MRGIKISFHRNPILVYEIDKAFSGKSNFQSPMNESNFTFQAPNGHLYHYLPLKAAFEIYDVEYSPETKVKKASAYSSNHTENITTINNNSVALLKSDYWAFQKESRFVIHVVPFPVENDGQLVLGGRSDHGSNPLLREVARRRFRFKCF